MILVLDITICHEFGFSNNRKGLLLISSLCLQRPHPPRRRTPSTHRSSNLATRKRFHSKRRRVATRRSSRAADANDDDDPRGGNRAYASKQLATRRRASEAPPGLPRILPHRTREKANAMHSSWDALHPSYCRLQRSLYPSTIHNCEATERSTVQVESCMSSMCQPA